MWVPSAQGRGSRSVVIAKLNLALDDSEYTVLNDVIVNHNDKKAEIDHLIVSKYGIFLISRNEMGGIISGPVHRASWMQTTWNFGIIKKLFDNPIKKNNHGIQVLGSLLSLGDRMFFHNIILFVAWVKFTDDLPDFVISLSKLIPFIKAKHQPVLTNSQRQAIVQKIKDARYG